MSTQSNQIVMYVSKMLAFCRKRPLAWASGLHSHRSMSTLKTACHAMNGHQLVPGLAFLPSNRHNSRPNAPDHDPSPAFHVQLQSHLSLNPNELTRSKVWRVRTHFLEPHVGCHFVSTNIPVTPITQARQSETQGNLSSSSLNKYQGEHDHWARD